MKIAFLDLDGTLLNSTARHIIALEKAMYYIGVAIDDNNNFLEYKRNGYSTKSYLINIKGLTEQDASIVAQKWIESIENEELLKKDLWYEDAGPFLNSLYCEGYKIVVVTARQNEKYIKSFLSQSEFNSLFSQIIVVDPMAAKENKKKELLRFNLQEAIFIGDTEVDYEAGRAAGIKVYLLNRGFRSRSYFDDMGLNSYNNLYDIMEQMRK